MIREEPTPEEIARLSKLRADLQLSKRQGSATPADMHRLDSLDSLFAELFPGPGADVVHLYANCFRCKRRVKVDAGRLASHSTAVGSRKYCEGSTSNVGEANDWPFPPRIA